MMTCSMLDLRMVVARGRTGKYDLDRPVCGVRFGLVSPLCLNMVALVVWEGKKCIL